MLTTELCYEEVSQGSQIMQFHKDNLRHFPRFPDFYVTLRILSSFGIPGIFKKWETEKILKIRKFPKRPGEGCDEGYAKVSLDWWWFTKKINHDWPQSSVRFLHERPQGLVTVMPMMEKMSQVSRQLIFEEASHGGCLLNGPKVATFLDR